MLSLASLEVEITCSLVGGPILTAHLGDLHAREFGDLCDDFLYASDHVTHLHNKIICAIAFNSARDSPEPGIAAWVTAATDKSATTTTTKAAITSDAGEQRLKKEVMAIHARDRRRLKNMDNESGGKNEDDQNARRNQYEEAYLASKIKVPEVPQTNTTGLTKTNWEPEIKKRYQQPLFSESAEFPDANNVFARMVPICYEEAIPQGSTMACAEMVVTSAEFFLKDFLSTVFDRTRANGPTYDNNVGGGIMTAAYKKQLDREMKFAKAGNLHRTKDDGLLPIEFQMSKSRRPLAVSDFKLANRVGPTLWNRVPLLGFDVENKPTESDYDDWKNERELQHEPQTNGHVVPKQEDKMDLDDDDFDWEAEGYGGRSAFDSLLDDCLAMPA